MKRLFGRRDGGNAVVLTICIMIVLTMTGGVMTTSALTSVKHSSDSRQLSIAREGLDTAISDFSAQMNAATPLSPVPAAGTPRTGANSSAGFSWSWHLTADKAYFTGSSTTGPSKDSRTEIYKVRSLKVAVAGTDAQGVPRYGLPGEGVFGFAAASSQASTLTSTSGVVTGTYAAIGSGAITTSNSSAISKYVAFDDAARLNTVEGQRSSLTAGFDETLLDAKQAHCNSAGRTAYVSSVSNTLNGGQIYCFSTVTIDAPVTVAGTGVATVIANGKVKIGSGVTGDSVKQMHLYSSYGGTIGFTTSGAAVKAQIFAPKALCQTDTGVSGVVLTGSLACRSIAFNGSITWAAPLSEAAANPGRASRSVFYLEPESYTDGIS